MKTQPPVTEAAVKCRTCGGALLQKKRFRLLMVGLGMAGSLGLARLLPWFAVPAIILALTGAYLTAWATLGKGRWCRHCKQFPLS